MKQQEKQEKHQYIKFLAAAQCFKPSWKPENLQALQYRKSFHSISNIQLQFFAHILLISKTAYILDQRIRTVSLAQGTCILIKGIYL